MLRISLEACVLAFGIYGSGFPSRSVQRLIVEGFILVLGWIMACPLVTVTSSGCTCGLRTDIIILIVMHVHVQTSLWEFSVIQATSRSLNLRCSGVRETLWHFHVDLSPPVLLLPPSGCLAPSCCLRPFNLY